MEMVLTEYLNSQFSLAQNLDFILRISVSCVCGACIGLERSRRYKEAGIRTHIIVCFAAALLMIGLMLPFFLFGIYEKDGQPLEKVLGHFIRSQFLVPKVRPYQTENFYAALERLHHNEEAKAIASKTSGKASKTSASRRKTAQQRQG